MTPAKRLFDIVLALVLLVLLLPVMLAIAGVILLRDGRPVLYLSERMKTPEAPFVLWKFRTMRSATDDCGVSAGYKAGRITRTGAWLRGRRLDELPQLVNILRGDMSFVGPRPPLRRYVEKCPETYAAVLASRPGVTGLGTLLFHRNEEKLLAGCTSAEETEQLYMRCCIPRKARLDLIWAQHRNLCFDLRLIIVTALRCLRIRAPL
ncbi:MAG: sugar transferase [Roseovarius sp.]|nr:sugar transferase [Roseovarius sp.]